MAKVLFLGTGASQRIPRENGDISSGSSEDARQVNSKSKRTQSSIIIKSDKENILIDCTQDFIKEHKVNGINFESQVEKNKLSLLNIDCILITHAHLDHVGGLAEFQKFLELNDENLKIPIYCLKKTQKEIQDRIKGLNNFEFINFNTLENFKGSIFPFRVEHSTMIKMFPAVGYKFADKLVYIPDYIDIPPESLSAIKDIDYLIVDGAGWKDVTFGHRSILSDIVDYKDNFNIRKGLYFTHIGINVPKHDEAEKYIRNIWNKARIAYDGLQIEIDGI
jgi:phosphoribosyl 1,2-cyclic phosphodiesterase